MSSTCNSLYPWSDQNSKINHRQCIGPEMTWEAFHIVMEAMKSWAIQPPQHQRWSFPGPPIWETPTWYLIPNQTAPGGGIHQHESQHVAVTQHLVKTLKLVCRTSSMRAPSNRLQQRHLLGWCWIRKLGSQMAESLSPSTLLSVIC